MKALVTGGGGFLGKAIVKSLLRRGDEVVSFSRGDYPELRAIGARTVRGDIADAQAVASACEGCDTVFHVAAKPGIWGDYEEYYSANVIGTKNVLTACRKHGIGRLVYTSSPSVVFQGGDMEGVDESTPYPARYEAAYPQTKAMAEQMVLRGKRKGACHRGPEAPPDLGSRRSQFLAQIGRTQKSRSVVQGGKETPSRGLHLH